MHTINLQGYYGTFLGIRQWRHSARRTYIVAFSAIQSRLEERKHQAFQGSVKDTRLSDVYNNTQQPSANQDSSPASDSVMDGLFSILSPEPESHPKEDMPLPRQKKKKKRRYGRQF